MGVLIDRAYYLGSISGPLFFGNYHITENPKSWNMHVGVPVESLVGHIRAVLDAGGFMLVILLSVVWGWRTVMSQLSGF